MSRFHKQSGNFSHFDLHVCFGACSFIDLLSVPNVQKMAKRLDLGRVKIGPVKNAKFQSKMCCHF